MKSAIYSMYDPHSSGAPGWGRTAYYTVTIEFDLWRENSYNADVGVHWFGDEHVAGGKAYLSDEEALYMKQSEALQILKEVYVQCSKIFSCEIQDAYLYGSYARGDYHAESDVDILLTVDMDWDEISRYRSTISHVISELCLEHDVTISVTVNPVDLFRQYSEDLPFYRNVRTEGIRFVA